MHRGPEGGVGPATRPGLGAQQLSPTEVPEKRCAHVLCLRTVIPASQHLRIPLPEGGECGTSVERGIWRRTEERSPEDPVPQDWLPLLSPFFLFSCFALYREPNSGSTLPRQCSFSFSASLRLLLLAPDAHRQWPPFPADYHFVFCYLKSDHNSPWSKRCVSWIITILTTLQVSWMSGWWLLHSSGLHPH